MRHCKIIGHGLGPELLLLSADHNNAHDSSIMTAVPVWNFYTDQVYTFSSLSVLEIAKHISDIMSIAYIYLYIIQILYTYIYKYFDKSHLSDKGIHCSIINIGDVNSY